MGDLLHDLLDLIRNPGPFMQSLGVWGLALIVFLETGAMVFFLPGDSLLFVAGAYAAKPEIKFTLWQLNLILIPAAILGDATSYWIGRKIGPRLFNKPKSRFFNPAHIKAAHAFYEKHGGKAIILARFMPFVRTFVPVVAGIGGMKYTRFAMFNVVGAAAWVLSMTIGGYFLGQIDWIAKRIELVIIAIVLLSISPGVIAWFRARRQAKKEAAADAAAAGGTPSPSPSDTPKAKQE